MRTYEVRCCCNPKKLLGWINLPEHQPGTRYIRFPTMGEPGFIEIELENLHNDGKVYRAVKSNDMPLEVFKKLPGFIENKNN